MKGPGEPAWSSRVGSGGSNGAIAILLESSSIQRFFEWFDAQTAAIFELAGLPKRDLMQRPDFAGFPLVETRAKFVRPSRFGDLVIIESGIVALRRSSFDVQHRLFNGGELAVEGFETRVWTVRDAADPDRIISQPIPADVRKRLAAD